MESRRAPWPAPSGCRDGDLQYRGITLPACDGTATSVIELAAGTGIVSRKLRDGLHPDIPLLVTDFNAPMLEVAKRKFSEGENVDFAIANAMLMLDGMVSLPGVGNPREIRLTGGASHNDLFLQIKASALGQPLVVVEEAEATALGARCSAASPPGCIGALIIALAGLDRREEVIEPDSAATRYDQLRGMIFEGIHDVVRPVNGSLVRLREEWDLPRD